MKKQFSLFVLLSMLSIMSIRSITLTANQITCTGILGNSGEHGDSLVRFEGPVTNGMGIVCDRYGSLWDRGGTALNRYSADGRLLASYKLPKANPNRNADMIALAGDTLILRLGSGLHSLPIDAPPNSEAKTMNVQADRMSPSSLDGNVIASKGEDVFFVNAAGEKKPVATLRQKPDSLDFGADGNVYAVIDWKIYKLNAGSTELAGPVAGSPGERPQFLDGCWYGSAWHSTLRRFDKNFNPSPGVVLGGNSGSFIGHVAEQSEIINGRGIAKMSPNLFAISGFCGVVHLLEWKGADMRFEPIRRIGALQSCGAIALDREGRVWSGSGNWNWNDGPAAPQHWGVPVPEKVFGLTILENDSVCGYGYMWGKPMIISGKMDKELKLGRIEQQTILPSEAVAAAVSEMNKKRVLLVLESDGKITSVNINGDGTYNSDAGTVQLATASPIKEWTSLSSSGKDTLLAGGGGNVVEFSRNGDGWKEKRRWNSFGQDKFGTAIWLAYDSGRLWVSDKARNRVLCFDPIGNLLASFGTADLAGNDLKSLNAPAVIAAKGSRAAVYDSGNQRIVKLELKSY